MKINVTPSYTLKHKGVSTRSCKASLVLKKKSTNAFYDVTNTILSLFSNREREKEREHENQHLPIVIVLKNSQPKHRNRGKHPQLYNIQPQKLSS